MATKKSFTKGKEISCFCFCSRISCLTHVNFFPFRVKNLNAMPSIRDKIYDPDPKQVYTKAKLAKVRENESPSSVSPSIKFPSDNCDFNKDFSVLPVFVPSDTLDHLKSCGKTSKYSTSNEAVVEMSSSKGLRLLSFVHDLEVNLMRHK